MTGGKPPTRCDSEHLTRFCAGELGPEDREQVAAHLMECEACWDDVRISRAAIASVQRLHDPAPTALRAEVRATISRAARPDTRRRLSRSHLLVLAAVAVIVLTLSGVTVAVMTGRGRPTPTAAPTVHTGSTASTASTGSVDVTTPVQAAVLHFGTTPPRGGTVPAAPDLRAIGLQHSSAGTVDVGGLSAVCYVYAGPGGARLEVFVGAAAWARPAGSANVGAAAWTTSSDGLTVIGGPDPAQDQMLVITQDHATAVSAATSLGLT